MSKRPTANPRALACKILRKLEQQGGFSNRLLAQGLEAQLNLSQRDRGLVTHLVYGILRHRGRIDYLIDRAANRPERITPSVRNILRAAIFEFLELDRPISVASSQANILTRKLDPSGKLGKLSTAITATIARNLDAWESEVEVLTDRESYRQALIRRWSIPEWMTDRWIDQLGASDALHRAQAFAKIPFIDLRLDLHRGQRSDIAAQLQQDHPGITIYAPPEHPQCLRVQGGGDLFYGPLYQSGLISIQSLGSQQAAALLHPQPGERILDACTGMGTKLLQLAELMQRKGTIVACDIDGRRMEEIDELRERGQLTGGTSELNLECIKADLSGSLHELKGTFDGILLDAPCTGLGNLARHPELRYSTSLADVERCASRQSILLQKCQSLLRPGGRLVYAVCSLEPEESSAQIANATKTLSLCCEAESITTPELHNSDGFYAARLRLSEEQ